MTLAPEEVKACCAAAYASPAARILLGESFHPGGAALTRRLIGSLGVGPGSRVVDVACGTGASTHQLARETGCEAIGLDLAPPPDPVDEPRVRFLSGDAEALPLEDASADGALCECALCTFPDKPAAVRELARVLRPGARLALSDMTAEPERLPAALRTVQAWVACIADARPLEEVAALLAEEGFRVDAREHHDDALGVLLDRVEARLQVLAMADLASQAEVQRGATLVSLARDALSAGELGYGSLVATRR